jgi:hypothetical protein
MILTTYPSLDAFYAADARRRHSRERDLGLVWRARTGVTFRAAWVQETGEVYLFKHGHPLDGGGTVDLLARRFDLRELDPVFGGYRDVCGRPESLGWFLGRAAHGPGLPVAA